MPLDETKLNTLVEQVIQDIGATFHAPLVLIGEKLGLFKAMAGAGLVTPQQLAGKTGTAERYVEEWLTAMASGGYVDYDPTSMTFSLSPEQAAALADENGPFYLAGAFQAATSAIKSENIIAEAFRTGKGVGWHEHDPGLFLGGERFYKPQYMMNLVSSWIPSLDGVDAKLREGARAADIGCGFGASTIIMAKAYPQSTFVGFDYHEHSIMQARKRAREAGIEDRISFEVCAAKDITAKNFDFITMFDCFHDMGDPAGVARHMRSILKPDGVWMLVEPYASDKIEENLNPIGRLFYCASVLLCTSGALAQEAELALGGQAGETRLRNVIKAGGFSSIRRAAQTPMNLILEARL
ncbi:MAG: class I SAM-dependent methyltransferase [Deltaproteobacteria bacterium]|nr:class I SAM-dependent methyltransferase [Deltaproteobacteria bacterium]